MLKRSIIFLSNWLLNLTAEKPKQVGGQAVIEGVMMKAPEGWSVAVRSPDGDIRTKKEQLKGLSTFWKLPLIRGTIILCETLRLGLKALEFSASVAGEEKTASQKNREISGSASEGNKEKTFGTFSIAVTVLFACLIAIGLFLFLPVYLTKLLGHIFSSVSESQLIFNLVDGFIRIIIFLMYIVAVGLWKDMRRIFEYHGAEHKVIHAYEAGKRLEIDEVKGFSPSHPRCGTSFLMIVMLISILVFSTIPKDFTLFEKFMSRIVLIPLIAGLSYEILKISSRYGNNHIVRIFIVPGLGLQRLTTREPDSDQLEVAIVALKEALSFSNTGTKGTEI